MTSSNDAPTFSWIDWAREHSPFAEYHVDGARPEEILLLDRFIQASAENPDGFHQAFNQVCSDPIHPLTSAGEGVLFNLVRNGVFDDWELYLQWQESGYRVVGEGQRQPQDAWLRAPEAMRLLDLLTGGPRPAPGLADTDALVQSMFEAEQPSTHRRFRP